MEINNGINITSSSSSTLQANSTAKSVSVPVSKVMATTDSSNNSNASDSAKSEAMLKMEKKTFSRAVEQANKKLVGSNKEMRLSVHEETKKINIKIIDKDTEEVIKEYPPEKLLDIFAKMIELSGLIVDEKR